MRREPPARGRSGGRAGAGLSRAARGTRAAAARARARRRAMETAALLDMEGARWYTETNCRERDWGQWDLRSKSEWDRSEDQRRRRHGLYFAPPGGESLAAVLLRVDLILNYLHGRYHGRRVLMVCHGELMWAFRLRFEKLNQIQYRDMADVARGDERIHNARARVRPAPPRCPSPVRRPRPESTAEPRRSAARRAPPRDLGGHPAIQPPVPRDRRDLRRLPLHAARDPVARRRGQTPARLAHVQAELLLQHGPPRHGEPFPALLRGRLLARRAGRHPPLGRRSLPTSPRANARGPLLGRLQHTTIEHVEEEVGGWRKKIRLVCSPPGWSQDLLARQ